jgi:TadE-like protein
MRPIHTDGGQAGKRSGNTIIEFALVMVFLVPMFAGAFSIGMSLAKGIQVSNVARDAVVLLVRSTTDPQSGLDLSQTQNQRIIVKAANGLGMNSDAQFDPSSTGNAVVILSKVVMVGPNECSLGVIPPPSGVPNSTPPNYGWTPGNCANYNQYVFEYRVVIGNGTRWSSTFGTPPASDVQSNGTITAVNIATNSALRAPNFPTATGMTLSASVYALVSEMYADVSFLNFFSILPNPSIIYARSIS